MKQKYSFFDGGDVEFDDAGSVRALIACAFEQFGYYEPMGMEIVTVFQAHHPDTNTGWFTTDVTRSCAEEIKNPGELCFAYCLPDVFYFAEGGWGHHMPDLGNHPEIPNAVTVILAFEDFEHTVVINGRYCFRDIIDTLKRTGYIEESCRYIEVVPVGCAHKSYRIPFSDPITQIPLTELDEKLEQYHRNRFRLQPGEYIYHTVLKIC